MYVSSRVREYRYHKTTSQVFGFITAHVLHNHVSVVQKKFQSQRNCVSFLDFELGFGHEKGRLNGLLGKGKSGFIEVVPSLKTQKDGSFIDLGFP